MTGRKALLIWMVLLNACGLVATVLLCPYGALQRGSSVAVSWLCAVVTLLVVFLLLISIVREFLTLKSTYFSVGRDLADFIQVPLIDNLATSFFSFLLYRHI